MMRLSNPSRERLKRMEGFAPYINLMQLTV